MSGSQSFNPAYLQVSCLQAVLHCLWGTLDFPCLSFIFVFCVESGSGLKIVISCLNDQQEGRKFNTSKDITTTRDDLALHCNLLEPNMKERKKERGLSARLCASWSALRPCNKPENYILAFQWVVANCEHYTLLQCSLVSINYHHLSIYIYIYIPHAYTQSLTKFSDELRRNSNVPVWYFQTGAQIHKWRNRSDTLDKKQGTPQNKQKNPQNLTFSQLQYFSSENF